MQKFKYVAVNLQKETFTGIFMAENENDLAVQLSKQNLFLVSCKPYSDKTPNAFFTLGTGKVTLSELSTFCRQFAIMTTAGMPLLDVLAAMKEQSFSALFKGILLIIYDDVKGGMMLSEALKKHKKVFPDFFISMVYVGEESGSLEKIFSNLADYYENENEVKRKIASALSYPIVLLVLIIGIIVLMLAYIVPTFRESLAALNVKPEGITKVVYDISDFVLGNYDKIILVVFAVVAICWLIGRTESGKLFYDKLVLKLPLFRNIVIDRMTAKFARSFSLLLSRGMSMVEALETVTIIMGNRYVVLRMKKAIEDIKAGAKVSETFRNYKLFPPMLIQMIAVGEATASMEEVLARSCTFFDEKVNYTIASVTAKIQPIMLVIMGLVVAIMFIAVYSPMLSIMDTLV